MRANLKKKRGLVLEGGGAKGAYAFGCLLAFKEHGFEFDSVAGTSIGGINAACWAAQTLDEGEKLWRSLRPSTLLHSIWIFSSIVIISFFLPHPGTCRLASLALDDDACLLAGAEPDLQRKAGRDYRSRHDHLRISRLSGPSIRGYSSLQA